MYTASPRVNTFSDWRSAARRLLQARVPPEAILWQGSDETQQTLFVADEPFEAPGAAIFVPGDFVKLAGTVARHADPKRWHVLYRLLWRLNEGERTLLKIETDADVGVLRSMQKEVDHDIYKMRAFVRFRRVVSSGAEQFVAWYEPYHRTLDANAAFFVERFGGMNWAILAPYQSMIWDQRELRFGPGVPRSQAPAEDELEELWRGYYSAIYNPARLNLTAMRAQLPVRRWKDLPEAQAIPELVRISRGRVHEMAERQPVSAQAFLPSSRSLDDLRNSVRSCRACGACGAASGPVFGEGPHNARIVLVGEQPGDEEDQQGRPFVGPAGKVLDDALREVGLDRAGLYLTNATKAFQFTERGKRRIHKTPRASDLATCRPWLDAELEVIRPDVIVALGASAAQSVLGRSVRIGEERGRALLRASADRASAKGVIVTYHPSALLRAPDPDTQKAQRAALVSDLRLARTLAHPAVA